MTGAPKVDFPALLPLLVKGHRRSLSLARAALYKLLALAGHHDYVKFILLTRSRTGSNLLVSLLNDHPEVFVEGEIFARMGGRDPLARLASVFGRQPRHIKAKGFKVFYYHPLDADGTALWSGLAATPDLRIVHLTRSNILRTLVSRKIAGMQGRWTGTHFDKDDLEDRRIEFSVPELEAGFRQTRDWQDSAGVRFPGLPMLNVTYEELTTDSHGMYARILTFIGVRQHVPRTSLRKQNPENLRLLIRNYEQLKSAFQKTCWASYFDD